MKSSAALPGVAAGASTPGWMILILSGFRRAKWASVFQPNFDPGKRSAVAAVNPLITNNISRNAVGVVFVFNRLPKVGAGAPTWALNPVGIVLAEISNRAGSSAER